MAFVGNEVKFDVSGMSFFFFWCLHALLWHRCYIIQIHFNIHHCGLGEGFMSVVSVCTLRTAWQLVPYITASQPHTHIWAHTYTHTHKQVHAHAFNHRAAERERKKKSPMCLHKRMKTNKWQTLDVFFYLVGMFVWNYLMLSLLWALFFFYSFNLALRVFSTFVNDHQQSTNAAYSLYVFIDISSFLCAFTLPA